MKHGFVRVAAATPSIKVADCAYNADQICQLALNAPGDTALMVFPELCITGYTCGDLFLQDTLLRGAGKALETILGKTVGLDMVLVVGLPVRADGALYDCAAVCYHGDLLGLVPKNVLKNYAAFYETRHFTKGSGVDTIVTVAGQPARLCADQVFACRQLPAFCIGVTLGDDDGAALAKAGATVIVNLTAADECVGAQAARLRKAVTVSESLCCGYVCANAGLGESTTDTVFSGQDIIAENGTILSKTAPFSADMAITELDLQRLAYDRRRMNTFLPTAADTVWFDMPVRTLTLTRVVSPLPFIPTEEAARAARFEEILCIQAAGLCARLSHTRSHAVIGLSGGLDSALALMVAVRAYDMLGKPHADLHTVTMPCFGTTGRTLNNARILADACGTTLHEIDVSKSVTQHLEDIGHSGTHDVTYENAQARERTQVLMDLANTFGGLVIGTGDLSELALGWATYNGDHMSMYGVNASIPKTLVRHLVAYEATRIGGETETALQDILDTPVSPELLPPENGVISQKTEDLVGPYELHDFFLFHMLRYGASPAKIYRLCRHAFGDRYEPAAIKKWLVTFLRRFFMQQFKRSCLPDGPRIGSVGLSPRGDWRMPSDASAALWLAEAEQL